MKKRMSTVLLGVLLFSGVGFAAKPYVQFLFGGGVNKMGQNNWINLTGPINNMYTANKNSKFAFIIGGGGGVEFPVTKNVDVDFGLSSYYLHLGSPTGIVHPMFDLNPNFDTLNYTFDAESTVLLTEVRILCGHEGDWHPYILLGGGVAWNRLYDYSEIPTDMALSAHPMITRFNNRTKSSAAYEVGVGVKRTINKEADLLFAYRYLNMGKAELGTTPVQTTTQVIHTGNIYAHLLTLSILFNGL